MAAPSNTIDRGCISVCAAAYLKTQQATNVMSSSHANVNPDGSYTLKGPTVIAETITATTEVYTEVEPKP